MRTIFLRSPAKYLLFGGVFTFLIVVYLLRDYRASSLAKNDIFIEKDYQNIAEKPLFQQPNNVVIEHRGPHQPAAVEQHFENHDDIKPHLHNDDDVAAVVENRADDGLKPGELPANAAVAQDALNAIHEAAQEQEKQANANIPAPLDVLPQIEVQKPEEMAKFDEETVVISPHLVPRVPPLMSTAYSTGPGEYFYNLFRYVFFLVALGFL